MSRFVPTIKQLEAAQEQLPSAYGYDDYRRGPVFRVAVRQPLSLTLNDLCDARECATIPVIDFRLEWKRDPDGFKWRRWVYDGPVAV